MPDGTISQETYKRELKSLPPDGFVELKMLPYYDMLVRRDKGSIASMEQTQQKRGSKEPVSQKLMIESLQTWERAYMFKNCIVDHNITDKKGNPLNFNDEMALHILNPAVGMEIERYIDELHETEDLDGNFPTARTSSSEQPGQEPQLHKITDSPTS